MLVRCYEEGNARKAMSYEARHPITAAELFADMHADSDSDTMNVIVEPLDDVARGLSGWHQPHPDEVAEAKSKDDPGSLPFRMFVVRARRTVEWSAQEVQSFNPRHEAAEGE